MRANDRPGKTRRAERAASLVFLFVCIGQVSSSRAENWVEVQNHEPFVCRANYELADEAELLKQLPQLRLDVTEALALRPSAEPVELYLFDSKSGYREYLEGRFPEVPFRRAMFIKAEGPGMVYAYHSRELAVDLQHETTHAVLHTAAANVPLWLDEGVAEYFEVPRDQRAYDHPHLSSLQRPWAGGVQPLETLEAKTELAQMSRRDYRDSWAWVHYLLHGPAEGGDELRRYFGDLCRGAEAGSLAERLKRRMLQPEARLADHFRNWERPE